MKEKNKRIWKYKENNEWNEKIKVPLKRSGFQTCKILGDIFGLNLTFFKKVQKIAMEKEL